jgi:hypothetical protein
LYGSNETKEVITGGQSGIHGRCGHPEGSHLNDDILEKRGANRSDHKCEGYGDDDVEIPTIVWSEFDLSGSHGAGRISVNDYD